MPRKKMYASVYASLVQISDHNDLYKQQMQTRTSQWPMAEHEGMLISQRADSAARPRKLENTVSFMLQSCVNYWFGK